MKSNVKTDKIKFGEKAAFAVGEIYGSGGVAILSILYLKFLTDIVGITPAIAGTILMIARIWDAISDPLMGVISDNTRTKLGRRRPYILASGILIFVALFVLFMPFHSSIVSQTAKVAYFIFAHIFYSTISTVFNVPYLSLTSEISQDTKERSLMNFARTACGMLASALIFVVSSELFGKAASMSTQKFSWTIIIVFGLMFSIPILCSAIFTKERTPLPEHKSKFSIKTFTNTFKLKCFRRLLIMYVFSFICNEIIASIIITYVYNVAGGADITILGFQLPTVVNICMLGGAGLIMPVVLVMIAKKVPKPVIFMCGVPMFLGGAIGLACFPSNASDPRLMMLPALIAGLGFGMAQVIPWLTFPDVVDVAELKSNDRNPGAYNSTMTFFKKFSSGLAVFLVGLVLETTGYDESLGTDNLQPESAVTGMRLILGICISAFLVIAFVGAFLIKITTQKSERVTYFISKQRAGELDTLDEQEQAELENLKKELF